MEKKFTNQEATQKLADLQRFSLFAPIISIGLFLLLYVIAAANYPGGSWLDAKQQGFSFWHNYLCDLLDQYAINGALNSGRHYARTSLVVLCIGLVFLCNRLPELFPKKNHNVKIMKFSGTIALAITLFLESSTHDITMRLAGLFGIIAIRSILIELFRRFI